MNIKELHPKAKFVSAIDIFKGEKQVTKSIHLSKGAQLPKHQSKTRAFLICITGEVRFENVKGDIFTLKQGDYLVIEPFVDHWLNSDAESYLLLIK